MGSTHPVTCKSVNNTEFVNVNEQSTAVITCLQNEFGYN